MRNISALVLALFLAGCTGKYSSARVAVLQNPTTKQTVECRVDPLKLTYYQNQVDVCIDTYKKAGYVLVADSADDAK